MDSNETNMNNLSLMDDNDDEEIVDLEEILSDEEEASNADENATDDLDYDLSAYELFHEGNTGAPCLSFDIIYGKEEKVQSVENPISLYFAAGTQASQVHLNSILLLKISNLKTVKELDEDEEENQTECNVISYSIKHNGGVNRLRATNINGIPFVGTWSELGIVNVWDLSTPYETIENSNRKNMNEDNIKPIFSSNHHRTEGFAFDWSSTAEGTFASGDCLGEIRIFNAAMDGSFSTNSSAFSSHKKSVEDIQWSPNEANVLASCSVDKSIRIWDIRSKPDSANKLTCENAHTSDVNVINWNKNSPFIVSGGDDSRVLIWDLRKFQSNTPVAELSYHNKPITTVEWHPSDPSVLASGSEDDQLLQWDLGVERDAQDVIEEENVPEQLLFIHKGQKELKELHWHKYIAGLVISTAHSGFNIFKTISC